MTDDVVDLSDYSLGKANLRSNPQHIPVLHALCEIEIPAVIETAVAKKLLQSYEGVVSDYIFDIVNIIDVIRGKTGRRLVRLTVLII